MDELTLRPSKKRMAGLLVISALFVIGGFFEPPSPIRILTVGFFGIGVVVFAIALLPNSSWLKLTREGFVTRSLYRTAKLVPWDVVDHFEVGTIANAPGRRVLFNFRPEFKNFARGRKVSRAIAGFEGAMPDTYGIKADALAQLLNDWRTGQRTGEP